ncbi:MAG: CHAT domain-containing protein [bacterium]
MRGWRIASAAAIVLVCGALGVPALDPRASGGDHVVGRAYAQGADAGSDSANAVLSRGLAEVADLVARKERAAADSLGQIVLRRLEGRLGVDSLLYVDLLNAIGRARVTSALWREAGTLEMIESALDIGERLDGPLELRVAESLGLLSRYHYNALDHGLSVRFGERALAIREAKQPENSADISSLLSLLSTVEHYRGNSVRALQHADRCIRISEAVYGSESVDVAFALNNSATVLTQLGEHGEAVARFERAIAIYAKALGPDNARQVWPLVNLGEVYRQTGEFAKGIEALESAAAIAEKAYGPGNSELGAALINLGLLEIVDGRADDARAHLERALEIKLATDGAGSPTVAVTLLALGHLLGPMGETARAESLLERGMKICATAFGPENLRMDSFRINLAALCYARGDTARARTLYDDALATRERKFGPNHPQLGEVLAPYAAYLALARADATALDLALRAERIGRDHLRLAAQTQPEIAALRYAAVRASGLDLALGLAASGRLDPRGAERAWDALVASRALVLEEMATRRELFESASDPVLRALWDRFGSASRDLARVLLEEGEGASDTLRARIEAARSTRDGAERELAVASAGFRRGSQSRDVTLREVLAALPPGSVLVSYARYRDLLAHAGPASLLDIAWDPRASGTPRDVVLVARGGKIEAVVDLGDAAAIDRAVARWLDESSRGALVRGRGEGEALAAYAAAGDALRRAIWDPIAPHVAGASRVFIVPDGPLALVSFAALPLAPESAPGRAESGLRFLIDGEPALHMLNSEREVVEWDARAAAGDGLLALGGAAFDRPGDERLEAGSGSARDGASPRASGAPAGARDPLGESGVFRGQRAGCAPFRELRFAELPASRGEAEEVARRWAATVARASSAPPSSTGGAATLLTGERASEASVKRLAPGRRVVHLASHGFFLRADCEIGDAGPAGEAGTRGIGGLSPSGRAAAKVDAAAAGVHGAAREAATAQQPPRPARAAAANPLRLSGLALAGANLRATAAPAHEDGILTAEEVAALDLRGVAWVVLSACDTGVGDLGIGEGVFGLRRAFQIAGARTVVSSLWAVRDDVAAGWMSALYESRWSGGDDTASAVRSASRRLLEARRASGASVHPFYWGGFIATGDWR